MQDDCPRTLLEAARYFADLDACNEYMKRIKRQGGAITCPACGAKGERISELRAVELRAVSHRGQITKAVA